jgi:hypothetical protein
MNYLLYKLLSASFYGIFWITSFVFLKKLTRNIPLSFASVILSSTLPPFVFYSWPIFDFSNLIGAWCVFMVGIFFFIENKKHVIFKVLTFFFSFFSAFASDQSRLYTLPFLGLLFLFHPEKRKKNLFLLASAFLFIVVSLIFHLSLVSKSIIPRKIEHPFITLIYYIHFIVCYFLYCYDYTGLLLFESSFLRFIEKKTRKYVFWLFFASGILFILSMPVYPYTNVLFNFFFVTPSIP